MTDAEIIEELAGWCQCIPRIEQDEPCLACAAASRLEALAKEAQAARAELSASAKCAHEEYLRGLRDSLQSQLEERDFANAAPIGPWSRNEIEHVREAAKHEADPVVQRVLRLFIRRMPTEADVRWAEDRIAAALTRLAEIRAETAAATTQEQRDE